MPWLIQTYSTDSYQCPPPLADAAGSLSYKAAGQLARQALKVIQERRSPFEVQPPRVVYPLGLECRRVQSDKVIKPSAFLFRTPQQRSAFEKAMAKFTESSACGLELLALRRNSDQRSEGSIEDVARLIYELIRRGELNPTKALNLTRPCQELAEVVKDYPRQISERKGVHLDELIDTIDARRLAKEAALTGLHVTAEDVHRI